MRKGLFLAAAIAAAGVLLWFLRHHGPPTPQPAPPAAITAPARTPIPFADARPVLDAHRADLPADLAGKSDAEVEAVWPAWAARHDAAIRARLAQGDDDSIVNLWLYGTTFTSLPRATDEGIASLGSRDLAEELLLRRLDDLVDGLALPGTNERLQFAREVLAGHGIDPASDAGQQQARLYLAQAREHANAEYARYQRDAEAVARGRGAAGRAGQSALDTYATMYRDRGLSSDTRLTADFALDKALEALAAKGALPPQGVRHVAIIGPGLDFTDKAEGYDFYPLQTIQPFALVDSLARLGLAKPGDVRVTTLDLSPRVNRHLEAARRRAEAGEPYVIQLPLPQDDRQHQWHPDLVAYWQRFGDRIGEDTAPMPPPPVAGDVRIRALRVLPAVTTSITPQDLDIIVERLQPLPESERFDVIVATNILVYYGPFDQALALANIATMLRPGGYFVTNYKVSPLPPFESTASVTTSVFFDKQGNGDTIFCYQRR